MKFTFSYGIGIANASREETVELPDDSTEEDIEEAFQLWCGKFINAAWWKADE